MLNIFKSPKKQEILTQDESSLLVKQFNGLNIQVYGTYEEPLFKAKDIGDLLEIRNVRDTVASLDDSCKVKCNVGNADVGNASNTWYLTEYGLYELLFISRKPIGKQFKIWIRNIIKEIRLKGKYEIQQQLKLKEQKELEYQKLLHAKEQELLKYKEKTYEAIEKTGHIYVMKTDAQGAYKVGKTKDLVSKRVKGLQTGNVNDIEVLLDFQTSNADLIEKCVHYILDRYRCNSNREFFDCNINYIKIIVETCGNVIDTLKSTYQHISIDELVDKLKCNGADLDVQSKDDIEDINSMFVTQHLIKGGEFVKWTELYDRYKTWYEQNTSKMFPSNKKKVKEYFERNVFKREEMPVNSLRGWTGWSLNPESKF